MDIKEKARLHSLSNKLTRQQWRALVLWLLREDMASDDWARVWEQGFRRVGARGRMIRDGNLVAGRVRTVYSLSKLGLLTAPRIAPDTFWKRQVTYDGRMIAMNAPDGTVLTLPEPARSLFREQYRKTSELP